MKQSVLICDDSAMARRQMHASLPEEWDVEVTFASNGREALDLLRDDQSDILFLDLTMPVMSGYEVLQQIRANGIECSVFVVSADIQPAAMARVTELGALEFLTKPVDREQLRERLLSHGLLTRVSR